MASGDTLLIFTPLQNEPTTANYATLDVNSQHPVLDFDQTTNESAVFSGVMPRTYEAGVSTGVTVYIHYSAAVNTGNVDWDVSFERIGDGQQNITADGFATVNSVDNTNVPGTVGLVDIVNVAFTDGADMDSVAEGELFRIKVTRDAASDTSAGDIELHAIEIKET